MKNRRKIEELSEKSRSKIGSLSEFHGVIFVASRIKNNS